MITMITRMMSVLLSLCLIINPCMAQESLIEDNFDSPMIWMPEEKVLDFGDLRLTVWILPRDAMIAPHAGYLLYRGDVGQLLERMNNFQGRIDEVIAQERSACDTQLTEARESCIRQNTELRINFDAKVKEIGTLTTNINDLRDTVFIWKIVAGAASVLALSAGIYAVVK